MNSFKDKTGQQWDLEITVHECKKIKSRHNIDLLESEDADAQLKLLTSFLVLSEVIWCLVEEQAKGRSIIQEQFDELLTGTEIKAARETLHEEILFFSQQYNPNLCRLWKKGIIKLGVLQEVQIDSLIEFLDSPKLEEGAKKEIQHITATALEALTKQSSTTAGTPSTP